MRSECSAANEQKSAIIRILIKFIIYNTIELNKKIIITVLISNDSITIHLISYRFSLAGKEYILTIFV